MNCATCKVNKIGPKTAPFGGFLCGNEHLQCKDCNAKSDGQCGICDDSTNFVQMNFNQRKALMTIPTASAPGLESECNLQMMETDSSYVFTKAFFADLETQSSISREQLSLRDSHESMAFDNMVALEAQQQQLMLDRQLQQQQQIGPPPPIMSKKSLTQFGPMGIGQQPPQQPRKIHPSPQDHIQMETLFFGTNQQQKSASNFKFPQQDGIMQDGIMDQSKLGSENDANDSSIKQTQKEVEENGVLSFHVDDKDKAVSKTIGEDIEEVIHTSEIRFMESTESMKNYYSGGTMHPIMKSKHEHQSNGSNQQETLSVKMLQDFEGQNTANPSEVVESYLRSYGPLALCHFPAYSFVHNYLEGSNSEHMVASEQQHQEQRQQQQQQLQFQQHHQQIQQQQFQHHQQQIQKHQQQIHKHQQQHFQHHQHQQHQQHQDLAQQQQQLQQQQQPQHPQQPQQNQEQLQAHMRSISISTESAPSLAGVCPQKKIDLPSKYLTTDYFVMHSTGVAEPTPGTLPTPDKIARPSIDMRMQRVLETFQEDPRAPRVCEKPLLDQAKNFIKILVTEPTAPPQIPDSSDHITTAGRQSLGTNSTCEMHVNEKTSHDMITQLSNSHRAFYNPPTGRICSLYEHQHAHEPPHSCTAPTEPQPQYQVINGPNMIAGDLVATKARYINMKPMPACQLNIPRSPIQCPESSCQRMIFVSDFNKHLIVDHSKLPMERIATHQCKNFFLDPRVAHSGISKCHLLYLIRDKITDLGSSKFKDFLPLLVMSTRVKLSQLCGINALQHPEQAEAEIEFLMIWLTGIVPEEFPVWVSLTVWPRSGQVPTCHLVHSGEMYSVRRSQRVTDVCKSGQMLLLSPTEVQLLTNNGKEMLELQLVVH